MLAFNQIKNSVRSSFANLKLLPSDGVGIPVITEPDTRKMAVLADSSNMFLRAPAHSNIPAIKASYTPGEFEEELFSASSSSSEQSEQVTALPDASSSSDSIYTMQLSPNLRLFRGSQDMFGFDVYIAHHKCQHGPTYLFECPTVLPWDELVADLVTETGREAEDIVLSSKFYPGIVDNEVSYQAWLTWSRKSDGPCSTDLWLA